MKIKCPFCKSRMKKLPLCARILKDGVDKTYLIICPKCGYIIGFTVKKRKDFEEYALIE